MHTVLLLFFKDFIYFFSIIVTFVIVTLQHFFGTCFKLSRGIVRVAEWWGLSLLTQVKFTGVTDLPESVWLADGAQSAARRFWYLQTLKPLSLQQNSAQVSVLLLEWWATQTPQPECRSETTGHRLRYFFHSHCVTVLKQVPYSTLMHVWLKCFSFYICVNSVISIYKLQRDYTVQIALRFR